MKQIDRPRYKKLLCLALLFVGCSFSLFSLGSDGFQLLALSIGQATESELRSMVRVRNLSAGTDEEMRFALYAYHGITALSLEEGPSSRQTYTLTILHADLVYNDRSLSSLVVLEGNAAVEFSLTDDKGLKQLSAEKMVVDLNNSLLIAFGDVVYDEGGDKSSVQKVTGDIVSLNWKSKALLVTGGTTTTERKNSEDEDVSFFTTGTTISYNGSGDGIFFDQGFITTNKKHAYSSITADSLAFLSGGDLLIKGAYLSIGRVPVLWVPAFFIPGVRMVGNPAIGFSSDRGMFLNTTFEMYGTYPNFKKAKGSSFTSLLAGESDASFIPSGSVYGARQGPVTPFEKWASDSGSFLALMADSYEQSGVTVGLEARHSFFSKKVVLNSSLRLAVHPGGKESLTSFGDFPKVRMYGSNKFVVDTSWADLSITMPFYSDPTVRTLYGNRLTSFSFDALLGKRQEFPSDFSGDVRTFTWKVDGSFDFPTKKFGSYIKVARISTLNATIDWQWGNSDPLSPSYGYRVNKLTLPELQATISGELFSWSRPLAESGKKEGPAQETLENEGNNENTGKGESEKTKLTTPFSLDPTLGKPYVPTLATQAKATPTGGKQSITLGYSLDEKLVFSVPNLELPNTNWETNRNLYTSTNPTVVLDMVLHPSFFTFKQKIASPIITSEDRTKATYLTRQVQVTSATSASVPLLGIRYDLEGKLYTFRDSRSTGTYEIDESSFSFTKEHVTKHQVRVAKSFALGYGTISPAITATLYPLTLSLLPSLGYSIGPWTLSGSLKFVDDQGALVPEKLASSVKFSIPALLLSLAGTYDLKGMGTDRWEPLTLSGTAALELFSKRLTIRESFTFAASSELYGPNYFKDLTTTLSIPFVTSTLVYAGPSDALFAESLTTQVALKDLSYSWWKRRITLKLALDAKLGISFVDTYATALSLTAKAGFSIAEFLDFSFSLTSSNRGFHRYYQGNDFSFPLMWADLMRSFDLVGGGRNATQFNMNAVAVELTHYMEDWSLNCKYTGNVVLSGNQYKWVPVVQVFLQWKTIPELKVDEKWTESSGSWIQSPSS
ncbi:MAG: hypothetical protein RBR15_06230 [Sphaerochaeta sp.]|nr:hypothetical protein [Sphaerochaeta sp.]